MDYIKELFKNNNDIKYIDQIKRSERDNKILENYNKQKRIFKVNIDKQCKLYNIIDKCSERSCAVYELNQQQLKENEDFIKKKYLIQGKEQISDYDESMEDGYYYMINEIVESNTNYNGKRIWQEIYKDIKGEQLQNYIEGIHSSININIAFKNKIINWEKQEYDNNVKEYIRRMGEGEELKQKLKKLLQIQNVIREGLYWAEQKLKQGKDSFSKDETELLRQFKLEEQEQYGQYKQQEQELQQNMYDNVKQIMELMNCIECLKCKIFGKLQFSALATVFQLRLNPKSHLSLNQYVALIQSYHQYTKSIHYFILFIPIHRHYHHNRFLFFFTLTFLSSLILLYLYSRHYQTNINYHTIPNKIT